MQFLPKKMNMSYVQFIPSYMFIGETRVPGNENNMLKNNKRTYSSLGRYLLDTPILNYVDIKGYLCIHEWNVHVLKARGVVYKCLTMKTMANKKNSCLKKCLLKYLPWIKKIQFTLLILGASAFLIVRVYSCFTTFLDSETGTRTLYLSPRVVSFPDLSICPAEPYQVVFLYLF